MSIYRSKREHSDVFTTPSFVPPSKFTRASASLDDIPLQPPRKKKKRGSVTWIDQVGLGPLTQVRQFVKDSADPSSARLALQQQQQQLQQPLEEPEELFLLAPPEADWRAPSPLALPPGCLPFMPGTDSVQAGVQKVRELKTIVVFYTNEAKIPPSPFEPENEPVPDASLPAILTADPLDQIEAALKEAMHIASTSPAVIASPSSASTAASNPSLYFPSPDPAISSSAASLSSPAAPNAPSPQPLAPSHSSHSSSSSSLMGLPFAPSGAAPNPPLMAAPPAFPPAPSAAPPAPAAAQPYAGMHHFAPTRAGQYALYPSGFPGTMDPGYAQPHTAGFAPPHNPGLDPGYAQPHNAGFAPPHNPGFSVHTGFQQPAYLPPSTTFQSYQQPSFNPHPLYMQTGSFHSTWKPREACKFFPLGKCQKGAQCTYLHQS